MEYLHIIMLVATHHTLFGISEGVSTMYVTPNITINQCPGSPCLELNTYVHNASSYFLSDALFNFIPGSHFLDTHVIVANKDNFQMIGSPNLTQYPISRKVLEYGFDSYDEDSNVIYMESSTHIICTSYNETGFIFVNITNLTIINITFINCGIYFSFTDHSAGIHLINIYNFLMEGVSIQNSTGYGLLGVNLLGLSQIIQSSFIGNNQFVKNGLSSSSTINFTCNGKAFAKNALYYGNGDNTLAGGNLVIEYQPYGDYNERNQIILSALVISLGIDASFDGSNLCELDSPQNYKGTGLSIILNQGYHINITIQNSTFYRNQASCGANIYLSDTTANFDIRLSDVFIIRAMAYFGAFYINYLLPHTGNSLVYMNNTTFECNYAASDGSSLFIVAMGNVFPSINITFQIVLENCIFRSDYSAGNAIFIEINNVTTLTLLQCVVTDMQQTNYAIGIITVGRGLFSLHGSTFNASSISLRSIEASFMNCTFYNSHVTAYSNTIITLNGNNTFAGVINGVIGGAISLSSSTIMFSPSSNVIFANNSALHGGAIYLEYASSLTYSSPTNVSFINNTASLTGGAIYVASTIPSPYYTVPCFYQYNGRIGKDKISGVNLYFESNFAKDAGSAIYGGDIDYCNLLYCDDNCNREVFDITHHFGYHDNTSSVISSDPRIICLCDLHKCLMTSINYKVYPGETIMIKLLTIGQRNGIAPSAVFLYTDDT